MTCNCLCHIGNVRSVTCNPCCKQFIPSEENKGYSNHTLFSNHSSTEAEKLDEMPDYETTLKDKDPSSAQGLNSFGRKGSSLDEGSDIPLIDKIKEMGLSFGFEIKDVAEFIRLLKGDFPSKFHPRIDKRAGEFK